MDLDLHKTISQDSMSWLWAQRVAQVPLSQWIHSGTTSVLLTIIAVIAVVVYNICMNRSFYKIARKIPGPSPLPLIGNAIDFLTLDHSSLLDYLCGLMKKYNGVARVWLGPNLMVNVSKPEDLEIVLTSSKLIDKNRLYKFLDDILGQGLLNSSGEMWRKHRRIIAPTFHPSVLRDFVNIFENESKTLVRVLEKNCGKGRFNVFPYIRNCALDFITETALEENIQAQEQTYSPATEAAEKLMNITYGRMFKLWLHNDFIFYLTSVGKEYVRLKEIVLQTTEPLLVLKKKQLAEEVLKKSQNKESKLTRRSFFRQLVKINENGENFNDKEVRDEVITMIITGYETTAATISFVLVMLGIHQEIQDKVFDEVAALRDDLKGRELEAEDLTKFQYMDQVIKETLRLFPVGPVIFRECAADVPLTTCTIPKGASVAVVILSTHKDPSLWEDPEKFNPDNFLPEKVVKRHPYSYIPFSAGPRNCIGQKYAYLSMKVMLYHLLCKYKIRCDMSLQDVKVKSEMTLKMVGGFNIHLEARSSTPSQNLPATTNSNAKTK